MMPSDQNTVMFPATGAGHLDPADLSVYAMQLVSGDQAAAIAGHLSHCPDCRAELARIHGDLALVAMTVDLDTPSPASRQRLLNQLAREKRIAVPAQSASAQLVQPQVQTAEPQQPKPIAAFGRSGSVLSMEERKPKRRAGLIILTGLGWAAAAGLCLVAGSLLRDRQNLRSDLASQSGQIDRLTADAAQAHQLMDALTNPGAMRVSMRMPATEKPPQTPSGGVTYNPDKGSLVFLASNMAPLEQYKAYELWIIPADNAAAIPAGTFHPDRQGNAAVVMPDLPKGIPAKAFGVTIEPDGGSQSPTMPLVMFGN